MSTPPALGELARKATAVVEADAAVERYAATPEGRYNAETAVGLYLVADNARKAFIAACSPAVVLQLVALATGGATSEQVQEHSGEKTEKSAASLPFQPQEPEPVRMPVCGACGHRHRGRCRHLADPHFYESRADAPLCGCTAALTPERPADAD